MNLCDTLLNRYNKEFILVNELMENVMEQDVNTLVMEIFMKVNDEMMNHMVWVDW